jgi:glycosyltransferase involved in cell wall biosynthesis
MKILMITKRVYDSDIRIKRIAKALGERGYSVDVVTRGSGGQPEASNVTVYRVNPSSKFTRIAYGGFNYATWYYPLSVRKVHQLLRDDDYDLLYYHDLKPAREISRLGSYHDVPVIADLHEMYSEDIGKLRENISLRKKLSAGILLRPPWRIKRQERFAVESADGLITVSESLLRYYQDEYDVGNSTVVKNVPDLRKLDEMPVKDLNYDGSFVMSYIGGFTPQRGLETAIRAMPLICKKLPDAKLILVGGDSDDYVEKLHNVAHQESVADNVEFTGWVDFEEVRSYYEVSDVTLCPLVDHPGSEVAVPNKIFQSMAYSTPVIVSDMRTMQQIITETNSGAIFEAGDPSALSETILKLVREGDLEAIGKNGRCAVENEFNIQVELENTIEIIQKVTETN